MFDKLQNDLLLKHPLLWNIKIVPILAVTLTLHVIFFGIGYLSGAVNFQETGFEYFSYDDNSGVVVTFSILISLLIGIVWLVMTLVFEFGFGLYRGNSFKMLLADYNLPAGRLWVLIPLWVLIAPYIFNRIFHS